MQTTETMQPDLLAIEKLVLFEADSAVLDDYAKALIELAFEEKGLKPPPQKSAVYERLRRWISATDLPLTGGRVSDLILRQYQEIRRTSLPRAAVEAWAESKEIDPSRLTERVKAAMVKHLIELGVNFNEDHFEDGGYDEYLALAYAYATRTATATSDPVVAARMKSSSEPWDFRVRFYDEVEAQGVNPDYVRVAGAIDYAFHLGEMMGAFDLAEHVVQLWDAGAIDLESPETIDQLFAYAENAESRSKEKRGLLYKRVLNLGTVQTGRGMVVNSDFPRLWQRLMAEVAKHIEKREEHDVVVSKRPIAHAIRDLQYNLTEYAGGGTGKAAHKLNAQLEDAMQILSAEEIVEQLSMGRRKGVFRVIERLAKEVSGKSLNVVALKTIAEENNKVFEFIADYGPDTPEDAFDAFLDSAEAVILAEAALMQGEGETTGEDDGASDEPRLDEPVGDEGEASAEEDW